MEKKDHPCPQAPQPVKRDLSQRSLLGALYGVFLCESPLSSKQVELPMLPAELGMDITLSVPPPRVQKDSFFVQRLTLTHSSVFFF